MVLPHRRVSTSSIPARALPHFTVARKVGRLVEVRMTLLASSHYVALLGHDVHEICARAEVKLVVCADYRKLIIRQATALPSWVALMRVFIPKIERSVCLMPSGNDVACSGFSARSGRQLIQHGGSAEVSR